VDAVARVIAARLTENLGQQFIVENKPARVELSEARRRKIAA
jgi:hypothetical protein